MQTAHHSSTAQKQGAKLIPSGNALILGNSYQNFIYPCVE